MVRSAKVGMLVVLLALGGSALAQGLQRSELSAQVTGIFTSNRNNVQVGQRQTRGTWNYGAGVDFHFFHIGARIEYQGLIFKTPDCNHPQFHVDAWTHVAQPSAGLILTF